MKRRATIALLATALLLALATGARAAYDPLGSGQTKLILDRGFLTALKREGAKLSALAPAKLRGDTVSFPVAGGKFDPLAANGTVEHEGALLFRAGKRSIPLKALQLKTTQRRAPLSAKVGGSQLKLASAGGLEVARQGFGDKVAVADLAISAKLATRLGKKLHLRGAFAAGEPLGSTLTTAQPETVALLSRGSVALTLDPACAAKLGSLFVAVNPIFPAEHPGGAFSLPIFGGTIAPDGSQGTIQTSGSLELLQLGGGQLFWAESWLDLAAGSASPEVEALPSPPYAGKLGRLSIAGLKLTGVSANAKARAVSAAGTLSLDAGTAQSLNELFAKPQGKSDVFVAGEALGSVSFVAQGQ